MIRFRCNFCAAKIVASRRDSGKKGKCPKCKHIVTVPRLPGTNQDVHPAAPYYLGPSEPPPAAIHKTPALNDKASAVGGLSNSEASDDLGVPIWEQWRYWLVPARDEATLFLMAATFLLLCITNGQMKDQLYSTLHSLVIERPSHSSRGPGGIIICGVFFLLVLVLSLYHLFIKRKKKPWEKRAMLFFAVLSNAGASLFAGHHVIKHSAGWLMIFPIWNIISSVLLLIMFRLNVFGEECVTDRNAKPSEVLPGLIVLVIILMLCNFVFRTYWAVTFSICMAYTTSLDKAILSILHREPKTSS
jgi:hypothetical protein